MHKLQKVHIESLLLAVLAFASGMFHTEHLAPFPAALCVALWIAKGNHLLCFIASFAGCATSWLVLSSEPSAYATFTLLLVAIFYTIWTLWKGRDGICERDKLLILVLCEVVTVLIFCMSTFEVCIHGLINAALSIVCAVVFANSSTIIITMREKKRMLPESEQVTLCVLLGIVAAALSAVSPSAISIGVIFAYLVSLAAAYSCGMMSLCAAACTCIGASYNKLGLLGAIVIATLVCVMISRKKKQDRYTTTAVFMVVTFMLGSILFEAVTLLEVLIGSAVFACLPRRILRKLSAFFFVEYASVEKSTSRQEIKRLCFGIETAVSVLSADASPVHSVADALSRLSVSAQSEAKKRKKFTVQIGAKNTRMNDDEVTGDSYCAAECDGTMIIALSDGMGTGERAKAISEKAVASFLRLKKSGFDTNSAIDCVNSLLLAESGGDIYATLDIFLLDLHNGNGKHLKLGASPSLLIRKNDTYSICGESLPVGIINSVVPTCHNVKHKAGDIVVLMTDGICDSLGAGLVLTVGECLSRTNNPEAAAKLLMSFAVRGGMIDDMSVVFVFITSTTDYD